MIKAVLFDFDGVLTLDETGSQSICNYICSVTGIKMELFYNAYREYNPDLLIGKIRHEDIWEKICDAVGCEIEPAVLYDSFINTPINRDMLRLAQEIKQRGYTLGMVTDNKVDRIKSVVDYHKWSALFDVISVSGEIGSGKNHEDIFLTTFGRLMVKPEECVFIDNTQKNLVVPAGLGVKTLLFDYKKNDIAGLKSELSRLGIDIGNMEITGI